MSLRPHKGGRGSGYPRDLREVGRPDDPLFNRPLVYGRIDTGVVEVRRPGSYDVERHELKITKEAPSLTKSSETKTANGSTSTINTTAAKRPGWKVTARVEELETKVAELERRLEAAESRVSSVDLTRELLRIVELAVTVRASGGGAT